MATSVLHVELVAGHGSDMLLDGAVSSVEKRSSSHFCSTVTHVDRGQGCSLWVGMMVSRAYVTVRWVSSGGGGTLRLESFHDRIRDD